MTVHFVGKMLESSLELVNVRYGDIPLVFCSEIEEDAKIFAESQDEGTYVVIKMTAESLLHQASPE